MTAKYGRNALVLVGTVGMCAVVMMLLSSCALSAGDSSSDGSSSDGTGDSSSVAPLPGPVSPDDPQPDAQAAPDWLPIGPAAPNDPPPDMWYSALQTADCQRLNDSNSASSPLWTAAATLCDAVVNESANAWATGAEQLGVVSRPPASDCLERTAFDTLTAFVAYRQQNPNTPITLAAPSTPACALELTGVSTRSDVVADSNPVCVSGGARIRLVGRFVSVTEVGVGSIRVPAEMTDENTVVFTAPAADAPGSATVTAYDASGTLPGSATLQYTSDSAQAVDGPCGAAGA
ncbi:hypothetical protein [Cryobacterium sp. CG_9.6]|uniref:hypothetical protein n=1 Tax=Cryobacterium sp. CG_9.6 TaxID=2760710 RepID=UPI002473A6A7|nr:hypothetical protein [Cryobacterium sp. CG_9.6]MDH6236374.1 hypothetical protein [Cryobacterium sp. CG_9.6]